MPRQLARRHQDDVEADEALRVIGVGGEPEFGGGDDALLASLGHRFRRRVEGFARLDLDEDQIAAPPRYDVDLADRGFPAPRRDPMAVAGRSGSARRAMIGFFRQYQRALIELAARQAGDFGHFADSVLQRDAGQRLAQQGVGVA